MPPRLVKRGIYQAGPSAVPTTSPAPAEAGIPFGRVVIWHATGTKAKPRNNPSGQARRFDPRTLNLVRHLKYGPTSSSSSLLCRPRAVAEPTLREHGRNRGATES
jgi:hypothetical protein